DGLRVSRIRVAEVGDRVPAIAAPVEAHEEGEDRSRAAIVALDVAGIPIANRDELEDVPEGMLLLAGAEVRPVGDQAAVVLERSQHERAVLEEGVLEIDR